MQSSTIPTEFLAATLAAPPHRREAALRVLQGKYEPNEFHPDEPLLVSVGNAARLCQISRWTIQRLIRQGRLPVTEIIPGTRRIPLSAIRALAGMAS